MFESFSEINNPRFFTQIANALSGDQNAKEKASSTLLQVYRFLVFFQLSRTQQWMRPSDIDDLIQELVLEAWNRDLVRFDAKRGELSAFLLQQCRWKIQSYFRVLSRREELSLEKLMEENENAFHAAVTEDELGDYAQRQSGILLFSKLAEKDPKASAVILRHDLLGESLQRVANDFGEHRSTTSRTRERGLAFLKAALAA